MGKPNLVSDNARTPDEWSPDYTYARALPRIVCTVIGHRWRLVDDSEERKVRIVVPPGEDSYTPLHFVHHQTCRRCGAETWAETNAT